MSSDVYGADPNQTKQMFLPLEVRDRGEHTLSPKGSDL
jgi:hypothetical protein